MANRNLTAGMVTEVTAPKLYPVIFYEGEFASSTVRLFSGIGSISWNGQTWLGGGELLSISPISEKSEISAEGFSVTLSGMPADKISLALQSLRQGKPGKLWLGMLNGATGAVIADPYLLQRGKLDIAPIEDNGETCTISVQYESRLIDLERARERRYTHEDQQLDFPGDLGFEFVPALQDMQLNWGGPGAAQSPAATGGGLVGGLIGRVLRAAGR